MLRNATSSASIGLSWTELGPGNIGGRVNAIIINPQNSSDMLVGTAGGGIWGSNDAGSTWNSMGDFLGSLAVTSLAADFSGGGTNPVLFAGTGDQFNTPARGIGMLVSTNTTTWSVLSSTDPTKDSDWYYINHIAVNASGVMLVATGVPSASGWGAIYRSTDDGQTFTKVQAGASMDVEFDPNDGTKAVAEFSNGTVRYSTDSGQTWSSPVTLVSGGGRIALAFGTDSAHAGWVYGLVDDSPGASSTASGEVFLSKDDGQTWTQQSNSSTTALLCAGSGSNVECQGSYDNALWVAPNSATRLVAGGINLFESSDGGSTWTQISDWRNTPTSPHADQHAIFSSPGYNGTTNKQVYVGNDGGLYGAKDVTAATTTSGWTELNNGLAVTQFYSVAAHAGDTASANGNIVPIIGGAQDNGTEIRDALASGSSWSIFYGGDGGYTAVDPGDANYLYGEYVYLEMFQSTDGGQSAYDFGTEPPDAKSGKTANFIAPFLLDPTDSTAMFAGGQQLWYGTSLKSGATWRSLSGSTLPQNSNDFINAIAVNPANHDDVWVGFDGGGIYHSTNATATTPSWTQVSTGAASGAPTSIYIVPGSSNTVLVSYWNWTSGNIYETTDGGTNWQQLGQSLPTVPVNSVITDPRDSQIIYAGTELGMYVSMDGGQTWATSNQGAGDVAVTQLRWSDLQTPMLLLSTYGRGAWGARPDNLVPVLNTISPNSATAGSAGITLDVQGQKFATGATVDWNGSGLTTTYVSNAELTASVPSTDLANAGTFNVTVVNPAPGGGTSAAAAFTVNALNPVPTLSSIAPASAVAGASSMTLTVTGTNFIASSTVNWNGTALSTTYISGTQLTATLPASDLTTAGSFNVTVTNPSPGGGTSSAATFNITNPTPVLSSLAPTSATAGSAPVTVTLTGTGFVAASVVNWNGAALMTSYVSKTQLTATIPATDLASTGTFNVTVTNAAPGGGTSAAQAFTVNTLSNNPAPTLSSIAPSSATAGSGAVTITLTGSGFVAASTANWNGNALVATVVSATELTATIPASDLTATGTFNVTVTNPAPGGGTSSKVTFTVNNPAPTIGGLAPANATMGSAAITMTVNGTGFVSGSTVSWGKTALSTTYVSGTQLKAAVPATNLAAAGTFNVTVTNPTPGGGTSAATTFTVDNPAPTLSSVAPASATVGAGATKITVTGSGFIASSTVQWGGSALSTTYVSSTQLTASVPSSDFSAAGAVNVTVDNASPGGGASGAVTFTVDNPAPTLGSISPTSVTAGASATTITLTGSGFVSGSTAEWNGTALTTTYVSATQLQASVPSSDLTTAGSFNMTVSNAKPGGGTSGPVTFTVNSASSGGGGGSSSGGGGGGSFGGLGLAMVGLLWALRRRRG